MKKYNLCLLGLSICLLCGCHSNKAVTKNDSTFVTDSNNILDLTPDDETEGIKEESESKESLSGLDDLNYNPEIENIETSATDELEVIDLGGIEEESKTKEMKVYHFYGLDIKYYDGLVQDKLSGVAPDLYRSDEGDIYLVHNKDSIVLSEDEVREKLLYDGFTESEITSGVVNDLKYIMASREEDDGFKSISYILLNNECHMFILFKEKSDVKSIKYEMMDIIESIKLDESMKEEKILYWDTDGKEREFKQVKMMGIITGIDVNWEQVKNVNSILFKVNDSTKVSFSYIKPSESEIDVEMLLSNCENSVKKSFGEPKEENVLNLDDSEIIWKEIIYDDVEINGKVMDIGVYLGIIEDGVFYIEMSGNKLDSNDVLPILLNTQSIE